MAENEAPRGDHSMTDLRTMLAGEQPKPAHAAPAAGEPAASGEQPETPAADPHAETDPTSGAEGTQEEGEAQTRGEDGKFKPADTPPGVQKRIDKLVKAQKEAERRAAEAERKVAELQGSRPVEGQQKEPSSGKNAPPAAVTAKAKPEQKDFDTYDGYIEALADWRYETRKAEDEAKAAQQARQNAERAAAEVHVQRVNAAKERYPDYDEVMAGVQSLPITREIHDGIVKSEKGPDIAYHLAKNPDEVRRIAALTPDRQLVEMGKLEAKFETAATPANEKPNKADKKPLPKPPANVGGSAGAKEPDLNDPSISMGTFKRLAQAQLRKSA